MNILYTAVATATGGRDGHGETDDGKVSVDFATPKELGGAGGPGTNPEQLFATGYAACFGSALSFVAGQRRLKLSAAEVTARVGIGRAEDGGFGFEISLDLSLPDLPQVQAQELAEAAHRVCPYSNAVKGNVPVVLTVTGGQAAEPSVERRTS